MSRICTARLPVGTRDGIHLVRLRLCEAEGAMGNWWHFLTVDLAAELIVGGLPRQRWPLEVVSFCFVAWVPCGHGVLLQRNVLAVLQSISLPKDFIFTGFLVPDVKAFELACTSEMLICSGPEHWDPGLLQWWLSPLNLQPGHLEVLLGTEWIVSLCLGDDEDPYTISANAKKSLSIINEIRW